MTDARIPDLILSVATALGRVPLQKPAAPRPELPNLVAALTREQAVDLFFAEVSKLSGEAQRLKRSEISQALADLVSRYAIQKAAVWSDEQTAQYQLPALLNRLGVELAAPDADKHALAQCDLGITTADFFIADTGTIGLTASAQKPKAVSLLPRVHLAILAPANWRTSLGEALVEFKHSPHLTLISGPSRTSDIELILTLGVHGPRHLVVWYLEDAVPARLAKPDF